MFRFSKLKLIGLGGMGMVPIRSFLGFFFFFFFFTLLRGSHETPLLN